MDWRDKVLYYANITAPAQMLNGQFPDYLSDLEGIVDTAGLSKEEVPSAEVHIEELANYLNCKESLLLGSPANQANEQRLRRLGAVLAFGTSVVAGGVLGSCFAHFAEGDALEKVEAFALPFAGMLLLGTLGYAVSFGFRGYSLLYFRLQRMDSKARGALQLNRSLYFEELSK